MNRIFTLLALVVVVFSSCEDELKPSFEGIPELIIDDNWDFKSGDVLSDTVVRLWSHGVSATNVEELAARILLGTDTENMVECNSLSDTITLKPYNQYFCQVIPYDKASGACGQASEIYTFYCVPPVVAKTVNGNGEWSTTLDWGVAGDYMQPTTISVTPNIEGYPHENNIAIKKGQHSYKFKLGDTNSPTNAAYTHWWDDAKAIYCEPIIYTYKFTITVAVGDKTFEFPQEVQDIIINTEDVVRDHEFNVYRLAKIGNKVWTIDDYRATTYYYADKFLGADLVINKKTGGAYYKESASHFNYYYGLHNDVPEGFHISTDQDWLDLESYYGVTAMLREKHYSDNAPRDFSYIGYDGSQYDYFHSEKFIGNDKKIKACLSSPYGWETHARNDSVEQSIGLGAIFNAKPSLRFEGNELYGYEYLCSGVSYYVPDGWNRYLSSESNGIAHADRDNMWKSIRLVKD